jgi:GxxExxY protein
MRFFHTNPVFRVVLSEPGADNVDPQVDKGCPGRQVECQAIISCCTKITHTILGGVYDVYNQLGGGFLESVYQSAMEIQLREAGLMVTRQCEAPVYFKGHLVGKFVIDLLVENKVIVELKAEGDSLRSWPSPQFWPKPEFKRLVYSGSGKPSALPNLSTGFVSG